MKPRILCRTTLCLFLTHSHLRAADAAVAGATPAGTRPPGIVIAYSPASTGQYIGSPSLAVWTNGSYVASHDLFGPGSTLDRTRVYSSEDRGRTWKRLADLEGQWWSTLFVHRDALYLLGTSRENGFTVIRRSTDGGRAWTTPATSETGRLLGDGRYHCAPVPVVSHRGRLWRAMEDAMGPDGWGAQFHAFMMSVPEESELLSASNWTFSNRLARDPQWLEGRFGGWLEGNAVVTRDGRIVNVLRVETPACPEKAAIVSVSPDGATASFDPRHGFIDFPGGAKKFTIRFDPPSDRYWALATWVPKRFQGAGRPAAIRNTLALTTSADLTNWTVRCVLLQHPDPLKHGFQYVDWLIEADDLLAVCRTAFDDGQGGAHNHHDGNYLTFHRWKNFRGLTSEIE
jgi:hypothetical protein